MCVGHMGVLFVSLHWSFLFSPRFGIASLRGIKYAMVMIICMKFMQRVCGIARHC
jgi:hypothetical protein